MKSRALVQKSDTGGVQATVASCSRTAASDIAYVPRGRPLCMQTNGKTKGRLGRLCAHLFFHYFFQCGQCCDLSFFQCHIFSVVFLHDHKCFSGNKTMTITTRGAVDTPAAVAQQWLLLMHVSCLRKFTVFECALQKLCFWAVKACLVQCTSK